MKLVMRSWPWLAGLLAAGLICATYLLAQIQTTPPGNNRQPMGTVDLSPPNEQEAADSARLIEAVNAGDGQTALEILHAYGVAEDTVLAMATRLSKVPAHVELNEPFIKASVAFSAVGHATNVQPRLQAAAAMGYERPVWIARLLHTNWTVRYNADLIQCPLPPIAVLNVTLDDPCFIRFFQWYDRYAERLHSVVLNGENLNNGKFEKKSYNQANRALNALFKLIKARKPDAFVWLSVVKEDDRTDEQWLKAMTFKPDGLQISNLRQFHSPFAETRRRYVEIVGADMPMMVAGFYGQKAALEDKEKMLSAALKVEDPQARQAAETEATAQLGGIGAVVGQDLSHEEENLQSLGYRGLSTHWLLTTALANQDKATAIERSDLIDPRAGSLDTYYLEKDYARLSSLAEAMISDSTPGDMNWTVGKLYDGIVLLSQSPPKTSEAITVLDEVLAFDFKNKPGRDHYILGAVKWRIQAAAMSGDAAKAQELVQWVQNREFRTDLKSDFLKRYEGVLASQTTQAK